MQFVLEKCAKVTIRKGLLAKSKNITRDISMKIIKLEHHKNFKYLGINEANSINQ